jgi:hypothetical protein
MSIALGDVAKIHNATCGLETTVGVNYLRTDDPLVIG